MPKHFEVGAPRQTVNAADADKALERVANRVAEMIAPTIAQAVAEELKTNASSNGRKIRSDDITSRHFDNLPEGDEFDTLPDGDDAPARGGDRFDDLPTD